MSVPPVSQMPYAPPIDEHGRRVDAYRSSGMGGQPPPQPRSVYSAGLVTSTTPISTGARPGASPMMLTDPALHGVGGQMQQPVGVGRDGLGVGGTYEANPLAQVDQEMQKLRNDMLDVAKTTRTSVSTSVRTHCVSRDYVDAALDKFEARISGPAGSPSGGKRMSSEHAPVIIDVSKFGLMRHLTYLSTALLQQICNATLVQFSERFDKAKDWLAEGKRSFVLENLPLDVPTYEGEGTAKVSDLALIFFTVVPANKRAGYETAFGVLFVKFLALVVYSSLLVASRFLFHTKADGRESEAPSGENE